MYSQFILAITAAVKMLSGIDVCYLSHFWRANKLPCIPKNAQALFLNWRFSSSSKKFDDWKWNINEFMSLTVTVTTYQPSSCQRDRWVFHEIEVIKFQIWSSYLGDCGTWNGCNVTCKKRWQGEIDISHCCMCSLTSEGWKPTLAINIVESCWFLKASGHHG